jgi:hypothetical protein
VGHVDWLENGHRDRSTCTSCVLLDAGYMDEYNALPHRVPFCSEQLAGPDLKPPGRDLHIGR